MTHRARLRVLAFHTGIARDDDTDAVDAGGPNAEYLLEERQILGRRSEVVEVQVCLPGHK